MKNNELKKFYDGVYKKGERSHYTKLILGKSISEEKVSVLKEINWNNKKVLDVGCGTGELAYLISQKKAKYVKGIDYSPVAIELANKNYKANNLEYQCVDIDNIDGEYDVILLVGVLEHIDDPVKLLRRLKGLLKKGGSLLVTCPNWSNVRGHVLMTLKHLFNAKITLADIHHFTPVQFEHWARDLKMKLKWRTIEQSWGHGEKMITDFRRRLPNVLKPLFKKISDTEIENLITWLEKDIITLETDFKHSGAVGLYHLKK